MVFYKRLQGVVAHRRRGYHWRVNEKHESIVVREKVFCDSKEGKENMKKSLIKLILGITMSVAVVCSTAPTPSVVCAGDWYDDTMDIGYVKADGVRLRLRGNWESDVTLELMYTNEVVDYYRQRYGDSYDFNYMRRHQTGTYGYVHHDYIRF